MMWVEATTDGGALLNNARIAPWLDTLTACTLVLNVLVTCEHPLKSSCSLRVLTGTTAATALIVWRIWRVKTRSAAATVHPHRLARVMRIILDSGLLYTVCVVVFFGTTLAGSNAQYGVSDVVVQVIVRVLPPSPPLSRVSPACLDRR